MDKVRVLQVIGAMNRAGAETVVMNLMRAIDRNRFQFDFLVHEKDRCDYDDEIEALGGTIYRIPRYNVANGVMYRSICRRFFSEHPEIQVVHGHISSCSGIYLDEAKKAGCATIAHSHRESPGGAPVRRALYGLLIRDLPKFTDEFLACGLKAGIDRFGIAVAAGPHFNVMKNGIDMTAYECDTHLHEAAKEALGYTGVPLIGNVARMVPEKNQMYLLEVFARLLESHPDAKLALLGRGPTEERLRGRCRELGIQQSVDFHGVTGDVGTYMKAFDVFAFPSKLEGLGMVVVEAQAAGTPSLVSTAVPSEAVVSPLAERIALDAGVDAWAARLSEMLSARQMRVSPVDSIRRHGYDIRDVASWMERFYADLAEKRTHMAGDIR